VYLLIFESAPEPGETPRFGGAPFRDINMAGYLYKIVFIGAVVKCPAGVFGSLYDA
jgi:hypothetical protein